MAESNIIVVSIMSPGVAAGSDGFVIINGKFHRVPPHSAKLKEVATAVTLISQEENISDRKTRSQLGELAGSLLTASIHGLVEEVK